MSVCLCCYVCFGVKYGRLVFYEYLCRHCEHYMFSVGELCVNACVIDFALVYVFNTDVCMFMFLYVFCWCIVCKCMCYLLI